MIKKILIIGGTQEANKLAEIFHNYNYNYIISYAGIVNKVFEKGLKKRIGGFGGKNGLIDYIEKNKVTHVVDASHPFSNKISHNTVNACRSLNIPIINFARKPWYKCKNDNWIRVKNFKESTRYLTGNPKRIFLAIGQKNLGFYKDYSHHFYLLRLIEKRNRLIFFPNYKCIISKGPFLVNEDIAILKKYKIDMVITKNSGGKGAYSKIIAARELQIPIVVISRPRGTSIKKVYDSNSVLEWIG